MFKNRCANGFCAALVLALCLIALPVSALADVSLNIADGPIYVQSGGGGLQYSRNNSSWTDYSGMLTVTGTFIVPFSPFNHTITVNAGTEAVPVQITLNNVEIEAITMAGSTANGLNIKPNAHVALTLVGESSLTARSNVEAAVHVPETASLLIQGSGKLTANGLPVSAGYAGYGAAIGGNGSFAGSGESCGKVTITGSAQVVAQAGEVGVDVDSGGAGIGGGGGHLNSGSPGVKGGDGGTVKVEQNAKVTASSGWGAGIGGGGCEGRGTNNTSGSGGNVTVNGGTVVASSAQGAGIGSGSGLLACGGGGSVTVNGGTVSASSTDGAGIGGGYSKLRIGGAGGAVTMTGGEIKAESVHGAAIGGGFSQSGGLGGKGSVDVSAMLSYEWGTVKNGLYTVHVDSATAFSHDNATGFKGIRLAGITVAPLSLDFGMLDSGYVPVPQTITLTNAGSGGVHPAMPASVSGYQINTPPDWTSELAGGASRSFTIQPALNLPAGVHDATLMVATREGSGVPVALALKVSAPPTITGPASFTLKEGYAEQLIGGFVLTGYPAPTVFVDPSSITILWDDMTNSLKIRAGLTRGTYPVTLTAFNTVNPSDVLNFTLTVTPPDVPTISISPANTFLVGQCGVDHEVTIGAGLPQTELNVNNLAANGLTLTDAHSNVRTLRENVEYTKRNGSIIVTLKRSFLNSLDVGRYTLTAHITGGLHDGQSASVPIIVTEIPPQTGDGATPGLWLALCGLCGLGGLSTLVFRRARRRMRGA